ncbi:23S rRNA pseudouridine1911/1915/1917 synthase [Alkalispirochaeta americana]|uniref:23S rRNA pseudouridine1911/1915/1917 synthase n=1 Tax=Alkalispirochaeta americana TaxID=159291 RepID=A0A1N6PBQ5_9SPIO|nr:RNA pseudouridine synthase [Alkalispirochaeta americana]SIQ01800.1 23S rRNA pseudouridine1911/1915/1917 synthase [Alkalispirochaeta americana]
MSTLLYLDSWLAVVAKAAGEPVQTRDTRQKTVVATFREALADPGLQPVHRIDQPVSGAVILARTPESFRRIHQSLAEGAIQRRYLAVVTTPPEPAGGVLEDYLLPGGMKGSKEGNTRVVSQGTPGGRLSTLRYETIGNTRHHTILLVELGTGRQHQIRAQLAHRGWFVLGDARYGARRPLRDRSIALHSWYLAMPHPLFSGQNLICAADLPAQGIWQGVTEALSVPGTGLSSREEMEITPREDHPQQGDLHRSDGPLQEGAGRSR